MDATPAVYRADIAHTRAHIARIDAGELLGDTPEHAQERRARLVRQVANLEQGLAAGSAPSGSPHAARRTPNAEPAQSGHGSWWMTRLSGAALST